MHNDARGHTPIRLLVTLLLVALALVVPSVTETAGSVSGQKRAAAEDRAPVWPLPPAQPRIRYVTSYHGSSDFGTKKPSAWKRLLLGPADGPERPADTMVKPYGIAVTRDGIIYVTDTATRRVFKFDVELKSLSFTGASGAGKLVKPTGIAVDTDGRVFVADSTLRRVFAYDAEGNLAMAIGQEDEFANPSGLAIDQTNHWLYVADTSRHAIRCYSTVDGSLVRTIGKRGATSGTFNFPTNLFVDGRGRLYVTDTMNFRLQVFDSAGNFISTFGTQGDTPGTLNRPKGVGVDSEGHIYVVDTSFNNFQIFDDTGRLLLFVGSGGTGPGEFLLPAGLYVDNNDRIYVADQGNSRVQVFQYLRGATTGESPAAPGS